MDRMKTFKGYLKIFLALVIALYVLTYFVMSKPYKNLKYEIEFESPYFLLLLLFAPLFVERGRNFFSSSLRARPQPDILFSTSASLEAIKPTLKKHSLKASLRKPSMNILRLAIFISLVVAVSRPQTGSRFLETDASGRDIMLVLDTSNSMRALDFIYNGQRIDRLTVLKNVVTDFINRREGDRIGLVVFGSEAYTQSPLTLDRNTLKEYLKLIQPGVAGGETAIGDGIGIALKHLKEIKGKSKVIVLVSDGENNTGLLSPIASAKISKELGIKIYTIGIGTSEPVPFPQETVFGRTVLTYQTLPLDEKTLKTIAEITGGKYFYAKDTETLINVYEEINRLETRVEKVTQYVEYNDRFMYPLVLGVILAMLYQVLTYSVFRGVP